MSASVDRHQDGEQIAAIIGLERQSLSTEIEASCELQAASICQCCNECPVALCASRLLYEGVRIRLTSHIFCPSASTKTSLVAMRPTTAVCAHTSRGHLNRLWLAPRCLLQQHSINALPVTADFTTLSTRTAHRSTPAHHRRGSFQDQAQNTTKENERAHNREQKSRKYTV